MASVPPRPNSSTDESRQLDRRDFLKIAGAGASLLLVNSCVQSDTAQVPGFLPSGKAPSAGSNSSDIVVIGAGAWGGWTTYHLSRLGARVTMVDAYGPGNSRSTSGDETRGIRSSYGDRGANSELWSRWARESISRWKHFDEEWGKEYKWNLFFQTGDLIMRSGWEPFLERTKELWDLQGVPYELLTPAEVKYRWPVINIDGINVILYETEAGVARARRSCQAVAEICQQKFGARLLINRVVEWKTENGRLRELVFADGSTLSADIFVFAVGPWLGKTFPSLMGNRMRTPMGYVSYFATPVGDERFTHPNLPSFNFSGVTGWPTLPVDSRGFRVRGGSGGGGGGRGGGAAAARGGGGGARAGGAGRGGGANAGRGGGANAGRGGAAAAQPEPQGRVINPADQSDPDLSERWADESRLAGPRNFVTQRFPDLANVPLNETRSCHYEQSSSRNFIVDVHPEMSNVWIAGGGNAEGFKFGPVMGEYVAQRVLGAEGDPEIAKAFRIPEQTYDPPPPPPPSTPSDSGGAGRAGADAGRGGRSGGGGGG